MSFRVRDILHQFFATEVFFGPLFLVHLTIRALLAFFTHCSRRFQPSEEAREMRFFSSN